MSNVHVEFVEDTERGETLDILYWHHGCQGYPESSGWPAPEALDYRVYCEDCGERIEAVPLTEYGEMQAAL